MTKKEETWTVKEEGKPDFTFAIESFIPTDNRNRFITVTI